MPKTQTLADVKQTVAEMGKAHTARNAQVRMLQLISERGNATAEAKQWAAEQARKLAEAV